MCDGDASSSVAKVGSKVRRDGGEVLETGGGAECEESVTINVSGSK